jgi:MFS family permease
MTPYWEELRTEWRVLTAAFVGLSGGLMVISYTIGIMGPYLVAEFHWPRSAMALITTLGLLAVLVLPVVGRITDKIGVRRTALIGIILGPLVYLALSQLHDLRTYAILFAVQSVFLTTTTPPVYCRIIVQYIKRARGMALAIVASGPALTFAIGGPLLNSFVAEHGWRTGYLALAGFATVTGVVTLLLLPPERKTERTRPKPKAAKGDYAKIFSASEFWIIASGLLLTILPQSTMMTQFNLLLAENGAVGNAASGIISTYAIGMLAGRFVSGAALDRFPAPIVTAITLAFSSMGFFLFASHFDQLPVLYIAAALVGLSFGAETDIIAYLIVRHFGVRIYSTVYGVTSSIVAVGSTLGAVLVSVMLKSYGSYTPFMLIAGVSVLIGSQIFLLLPRNPKLEDEREVHPGDNMARDLEVEAETGKPSNHSPEAREFSGLRPRLD